MARAQVPNAIVRSSGKPPGFIYRAILLPSLPPEAPMLSKGACPIRAAIDL